MKFGRLGGFGTTAEQFLYSLRQSGCSYTGQRFFLLLKAMFLSPIY